MKQQLRSARLASNSKRLATDQPSAYSVSQMLKSSSNERSSHGVSRQIVTYQPSVREIKSLLNPQNLSVHQNNDTPTRDDEPSDEEMPASSNHDNELQSLTQKIKEFAVNLSRKDFQQVLDLLHSVATEAMSEKIPKTTYMFKKLFGHNLKKSFSFVTSCCHTLVLNFKSLDSINCPTCQRPFASRQISKLDYSFR